MHTATILFPHEFSISKNGVPATLNAALPEFRTTDRIGVVLREPGGGFAAAPLMLAAVAAFYDQLRALGEPFYLYPELYMFHVGSLHGYHALFEVWPERREVVLPQDPEALLGAINDRGITRLLLQDGPSSGGLLMRESVESARLRLKTVLRFGGVPDSSSVSVTASASGRRLVEDAIERSCTLLDPALRTALQRCAAAPQTYTPLTLDEALARLCAVGPGDDNFGMSPTYCDTQGVDVAAVARHHFTVSTSSAEAAC